MKIWVILLNIVILILILSGLVFGGIYLYKITHYTHITAVFDEAEPIPPKMQVFYKGFRIGKVVKVTPNDDYTATHMDIVLFPEDVKIPDNISVKIREYKDDFDYVDIEVLKGNGMINISGTSKEIPYNESNIAYKAAQMFIQNANLKFDLNIYIEKNIPVCAGLAGGSTNAAGVLYALNKMNNYF